jgi:hypothetical protein
MRQKTFQLRLWIYLVCCILSYSACILNLNLLVERRVRTFRSVSPFVNVSLLHYGCIGSSPIRPTTAITIRTLEVYWQSH